MPAGPGQHSTNVGDESPGIPHDVLEAEAKDDAPLLGQLPVTTAVLAELRSTGVIAEPVGLHDHTPLDEQIDPPDTRDPDLRLDTQAGAAEGESRQGLRGRLAPPIHEPEDEARTNPPGGSAARSSSTVTRRWFTAESMVTTARSPG